MKLDQTIFQAKVRLIKNPIVKNIILPIYRAPTWIKAYGIHTGFKYILEIISAYLTGKNFVELTAPKMDSPVKIRIGKTDFDGFTEVFLKGEYDFIPEFKPEFIIDVGANVGYATTFFANKFPEAKIISIEPSDSNFEMLEKNTSDLLNVTCIKAAVWNKKAHLKIINLDNDMSGYLRVEETKSDETDSFQVITLGDVLDAADYNHIDILKIDVEGAEKEIFSQNYERWLGKVNIIMIELHDHIREGCAKTFYSATDNFNFKKVLQRGNLVIVAREGAD